MVLFGVTLWLCFWGCVLIVVCLATLVVVVAVRFRGGLIWLRFVLGGLVLLFLLFMILFVGFRLRFCIACLMGSINSVVIGIC